MESSSHPVYRGWATSLYKTPSTHTMWKKKGRVSFLLLLSPSFSLVLLPSPLPVHGILFRLSIEHTLFLSSLATHCTRLTLPHTHTHPTLVYRPPTREKKVPGPERRPKRFSLPQRRVAAAAAAAAAPTNFFHRLRRLRMVGAIRCDSLLHRSV